MADEHLPRERPPEHRSCEPRAFASLAEEMFGQDLVFTFLYSTKLTVPLAEILGETVLT